MPAQQQTPPAGEPLLLADVKAYLRIDHNQEDAIIQTIISAVRSRCEAETGLQLMPATWVFYADKFRDIELPKGPVTAVTAVNYVDVDGQTQVLPSANYRVNLINKPTRVSFIGSLPSVKMDELYPVSVTYTSGFASLPSEIRMAMLLDAGTMYEARNEMVAGSYTPIMRTALDMYRDFREGL